VLLSWAKAHVLHTQSIPTLKDGVMYLSLEKHTPLGNPLSRGETITIPHCGIVLKSPLFRGGCPKDSHRGGVCIIPNFLFPQDSSIAFMVVIEHKLLGFTHQW